MDGGGEWRKEERKPRGLGSDEILQRQQQREGFFFRGYERDWMNVCVSSKQRPTNEKRTKHAVSWRAKVRGRGRARNKMEIALGEGD